MRKKRERWVAAEAHREAGLGKNGPSPRDHSAIIRAKSFGLPEDDRDLDRGGQRVYISSVE